jgi:hypothetical protein
VLPVIISSAEKKLFFGKFIETGSIDDQFLERPEGSQVQSEGALRLLLARITITITKARRTTLPMIRNKIVFNSFTGGIFCSGNFPS